MIAIVTEKYWEKYAKKLVEYKDYVLIDATDNEMELRYNNCVPAENLVLPSKLMSIATDAELQRQTSRNKMRDIQDQFFHSEEFVRSLMEPFEMLSTRDVNLFVILPKKVVKFFGKAYERVIQELYSGTKVEILLEKPKNYAKPLSKEIDRKVQKDIHEINKKLDKQFKKLHAEENKGKKGKKKNKMLNKGYGFWDDAADTADAWED